MILEVFILLQAVAIVAFFFSYVEKNPLISAISMVTSGILAVGGWVITVGSKFIYDAATMSYEQVPNIVNTPYLGGFNILLFGLSLLLFFFDLFYVIKG